MKDITILKCKLLPFEPNKQMNKIYQISSYDYFYRSVSIHCEIGFIKYVPDIYQLFINNIMYLNLIQTYRQSSNNKFSHTFGYFIVLL